MLDFVRMALMPKLRPPGVPRSATMQDTPEKGVVSIGGTGGGVIDLSFSWSSSISRQHNEEEKRVYDKVRVYYTRPDGTIDFSRYVEYEVVREMWFSGGELDLYSQPEIGKNMEIVATGMVRHSQ